MMVLIMGAQAVVNGSVPVFSTILRVMGLANWLSVLVLGNMMIFGNGFTGYVLFWSGMAKYNIIWG